MANQHMITAAASLERALSDINQYRNEIQRNLDDSKRSCNDRITQIDQQTTVLMTLRSKSQSDAEKANCSNQMRQLEQEKNQIKQTLSDQERYAMEQFNFADQNVAEIKGFISRLQTMA